MLRNEFHFAVLRCFNKSNQSIIKKINCTDLCSGQPKILEYLFDHEEARIIEIADGCCLDKSTVTGLIKRMEKMGLVTRSTNIEDGRSKNISLTEFGKDQAKDVKKIVHEIDDKALNGFSEDEKIKFMDMLNRATDNLSD